MFNNLYLHAPGLSSIEMKEVMKEIPDELYLPVKQWSLDNIIVIDYSGIKVNLYRVDEFNFSDGVTYTEFTLNIDYPDGSKNGKDVISEIRFIDTGMPPITTLPYKFEGNRITKKIQIKNNSINGSSTRIHITSYLFEEPDDMNMGFGFTGSSINILMTDSRFLESTYNPWQRENDVFTLQRNGEQTFNICFPVRLKIKLNHSEYPPVLSWDPTSTIPIMGIIVFLSIVLSLNLIYE